MNSQDMEQNRALSVDKDTHIQVMLNTVGDAEDEIDLGRVFHKMKMRSRVYAWVLVLCLLVGLCAPLLLYQLKGEPLTVSSVVTLDYDVGREKRVSGRAQPVIEWTPVSDLTAPDGTELDLMQVTSSYVLQNALNSMQLSQPITISNLRDNIRIERILTEDSRRQQEVASSMISDKNTQAYTQVQGIKLTYENKFVVSLTNGFGNEDSRVKLELKDGELRVLLDRILSYYNEYLVKTYLNNRLPDDEISVIDIDNLDILESLDLLRTAERNLYNYCNGQPDAIKSYRSWASGRTLADWMETLQTIARVNINYLYSYVYTNSIAKDKTSMITSYEYQLRTAQNSLDEINENIATVKSILDSYKNDEIYVSMQESDASKSTRTTTDYYNQLVIQQADNYAAAAELETTVADLQSKIASLQSVTDQSSVGTADEELRNAVDTTYTVYQQIREHMAEVFASAEYTHYADHSTAQGRIKNFISANLKGMLIGAVSGAVIGCGLWFAAGLLSEFHHDPEAGTRRKGEAKA